MRLAFVLHFLLFSLVFENNLLLAQQIEVMRFASISGYQAKERFGATVRKANVSGDYLPELFVGAPGASSYNVSEHGKIYQLALPFSSDTMVSQSNLIILGETAFENIGQNFELGDFNGDKKVDIVISQPQFNVNNGRVLIFFGPFNPGEPRKSNEADIIISGLGEEVLGSSISVVKLSDQVENGLLIGATGYRDYLGKAYFFKTLKNTTSLNSSDAYSSFVGETIFELFAETVASVGDVNGDHNTDFLIGASKHFNTKASQGAIYLFSGPFEEGKEYKVNEASTVFYGGSVAGFWPGKLIPFGDINADGINDFCISGSSDGKGKIALFNGRQTWQDTLTIGVSTTVENEHTYLSSPHSLSLGYGFSVDVDGDFNFNGQRSILVGAPNSNSFIGMAFVSHLDGSGSILIPDGQVSADSKFGYQVLSLPNTNTIETDPFKIDDFIVSAPEAEAPEKFNSIKSGVITVYTGKLNPPQANITYRDGSVAHIGDTLTAIIKATKGSRPIKYHTLILSKTELGKPTVIDSLHLPLEVSSTTEVKITLPSSGQIQLTQLITDDLGVQKVAVSKAYFAIPPLDIGLLTRFFNTVELKGDRRQTLTFESTASVDSNGATLYYDLLFSTDQSSFEKGTGFQVLKTGNSPKFSMTYLEMSTYLISKGFVNLNVTGKVYWSVRVRNRLGNVSLFSKMAINGPYEFPFIRMGLDPVFDITSSQNRSLNIQGLSTDSFNFTWSNLQSENPNAVIDYKFVLLRDTTTFDIQNPLYYDYSNQQTPTTYNLNYMDLYNVLEEQEIFWLAKADTVRWFYTILAIMDGQENTPYLPTKRFGKANIHFTIFFDTEVSNENELSTRIPEQFEVYPNFPNPFNPITQLKFGIPEADKVSISVYNMLGQQVYSWSSELLSAGYYTHQVNAFGWSSGMYIYQIKAGNKRLTGKMTLVK